MDSYLNKTGLQRVWTDIKKYYFTGYTGHSGMVPKPSASDDGKSFLRSDATWQKITPDTAMDNTSENMVQNKVIKEYIDNTSTVWSNGSPTSAFAEQIVSLSKKEKGVICYFKHSTSHTHGNSSFSNWSGYNTGSAIIYPTTQSYADTSNRLWNMDGSTIKFQQASYNGNWNNNYSIPHIAYRYNNYLS